jgi:DNA-binding Lrp family transcriptional regulator
MIAYILIATEHGKEEEIFDKVSEIKQVESAHIIFGEWDLIIKVIVENSEELAAIIMDKLRKLPGIRLTSSLIVAR